MELVYLASRITSVSAALRFMAACWRLHSTARIPSHFASYILQHSGWQDIAAVIRGGWHDVAAVIRRHSLHCLSELSFALILKRPDALCWPPNIKALRSPETSEAHRHGVTSQKTFKPKIRLLWKPRVRNGVHKISLVDHEGQFNPADILTHPFFNNFTIIIIIIIHLYTGSLKIYTWNTPCF
jgi:hypothetical protein